jgi:regulator of sigma E protease
VNWIGAILGIGLLIVVHEFGHYVVARWCSMRVERFSIGFGPALTGWRSKKTGTLFQLAPLPFGGFVEIKGMNIVEEVDPDDVHAYPNRPVWQRIVTIFAGPATNYLTAIVLALILFTFGGVPSAERWYGVDKTDPAYDAQKVLHQGDRILALDGKPVWLNSPKGEMTSLLEAVGATQPLVDKAHPPLKGKAGVPVTLRVQRDGKTFDVQITPRYDDAANIHGYRLGISLQEQYDLVSVSVPRAFEEAFIYPVDKTKQIGVGLYQIVTGQVKPEVKGPVGMMDMVRHAFSTGWVAVFELLMMLNVYLGLFNLLPLPALDGGRLVFLGYEMATRRRANPRVEATVHMVGILILAVVMVMVTFKDCVNL